MSVAITNAACHEKTVLIRPEHLNHAGTVFRTFAVMVNVHEARKIPLPPEAEQKTRLAPSL